MICKELKALRLKVNEDKTTYMVLGTQGRRAREDLSSEIEVCGEKVKSTDSGKCLGLIVSNDLTWRHQVDKLVKSCNSKQSGLWKCTNLLNKGQRKSKAEGIILSRLNYCIELVSQGRKGDLGRLQSTQSKAARWVLQTRKKDWSLTGGLRKLGWLSMAQQAAYVSIKTAMKILRKGEPERLYNILTEEKNGTRVRKVVNEKKFVKLKATTRKAWSLRSLRWMEQMPEVLRMKNVRLKATQSELKQWVKHHVPVRGDRILWGKPLTGEMKRRIRAIAVLEDGDGGPEAQQPGAQQPEAQNTEAQQPEAQHPEAQQPEAQPPEAQQPGPQLYHNKTEGQDGSSFDMVRVRRCQGPARHQVQRMVEICWWILLIMLKGQNETIERCYDVKCKRRPEEETKLPEGPKESWWEKQLHGERGCEGHRGSVGRVKTGEG